MREGQSATMTRRFTVLMLLVCQVFGVREQKFAMEPQDQTAAVGSRITLPCRIINKSGMVQWTKDGFGLGNLSGYDRYSFIGLQDEGNHTLQISPVTLEDDAIYVCQVGAGVDGELPATSRKANLSVLVPPEPPRIIQGSHISTVEGQHIELECISIGGKPPAKITWVDGVGNVLQDGIDNIIEPQLNQKTYNTRSILKMKAKMEYHNMNLTCQAQNTADRYYRSAGLKLEVKYSPKLGLSVIGSSTGIVEGQDIRLHCLASANPPEVAYRWFINNQLVLGNSNIELVIKNVSKKHHKTVITCEAYNEIGKNEESITLNVSYGPRFVSKPYSVQADIGATVTLTCNVDGNPQPNIVWIHEDSARVVSTSPNLTLTVTQDTAGRYFCRATVPGFRDIKADATIYMKGPPTIISHRTQYGVPGDNVRLECSAFSIPTPQKVVWTFQGEDVGSDLDYSVMEEQLAEGIKSTLIIQESRHEHFGIYNCTVSNPYGNDVVEINLKAQKNFPVHTTIVGVMGIVIIVITMASLYIMCQRKPAETNVRNTKDSKMRESDRSSNISDIKLEMEYSGDHESDSGSENALHGTGLPLAGPVPLDHRYSLIDHPGLPLVEDERNNSAYASIVDFARNYSMMRSTPLPAGVSPVPSPGEDAVDPRFSAAYGNPYLRLAVNPQLPPPPAPQIGLPPPPYNLRQNTLSRSAPHNDIQDEAQISSLATHV